MKTYIIQLWDGRSWNNFKDGSDFPVEFLTVEGAKRICEILVGHHSFSSDPTDYQIRDSHGNIAYKICQRY